MNKKSGQVPIRKAQKVDAGYVGECLALRSNRTARSIQLEPFRIWSLMSNGRRKVRQRIRGGGEPPNEKRKER
jgi:hypothetical protein